MRSVLLFCLIPLIVIPSTVTGQLLKRFKIPIFLTNSVNTRDTLYFGIHPDALVCFDNRTLTFNDSSRVTEADLPPCAPSGGFENRFVHPRGATCLSAWFDIRPDAAAIDTFRILFQAGQTAGNFNLPARFSWPPNLSLYCDSMRIQERGPSEEVENPQTIDMLAQTYLEITDPGVQGCNDGSGSLRITMWGPKMPPAPPSPPVLSAPADGDTTQDTTFTFTWQAVADAFFYRIEVSNDSAFGTILFTDTAAGTSKRIGGLKPLTTYYWRVRAVNLILENGSFATRKFTTRLYPPPAITLISPPAGQQKVDTQPTLRWNTSPYPRPTTYYLEVATDQNFSSLVVNDSTTDTSMQIGQIVPLTPCVTYYWHVRARNAAGVGPFSLSRSFRCLLDRPGRPNLDSPADNDTNISTSPTLRWTRPDVCSDMFRVRVARDTLFTILHLNVTTPDTFRTVTGLRQDTIYHWRVNALNDSLTGDTTAYRTFKTILLPSPAPTLVSPANNDTTRDIIDTVRWRKVEYATRYHMQIATDSVNFANTVVFQDSQVTDTFKIYSTLNYCTKYYWRVRAINRLNASAGFGSLRSFKTKRGVPLAPVLQSPAQNEDSVDFRPTFTWAGDNCSASFRLHVARDSTFTTIVIDTPTTQTSLRIGQDLEGNTTYYWRVRSLNELGPSLYSDTFKFSTTPFVPPPPPTLRFPPDGAGNISLTPTLTWDSAARATTYRLQVAYDTVFTALAFNDSTITTTSKQIGPLLNGTKFYWRVNAKNSAGTSAFSAVLTFTTLAPPGSPTLIRPYNGEQDVSPTPALTWGAAELSETFHVQLSKNPSLSPLVVQDSNVTNQSYTAPFPLGEHVTYYWRVRARNSAGWGDWSSTFSFTTRYVSPADWVIPLSVRETGSARDSIFFGVSPVATDGIDPMAGEYELPPTTSGKFDVRFVSNVSSPGLIGEGLRFNLHDFSTYSQRDTFTVRFQPGTGSYPFIFSWPRSFIQRICDSMILTDGAGMRIDMKTDPDSTASVTNSAVSTVMIIEYGAFPLVDVKPIVRELPKGYMLSQNYPNPFNPTTQIEFSTETAAQIVVIVYDVLGKEIVRLVNAAFYPGYYTVQWDGKNEVGTQMPSGVYYVRMTAVPAGVEAGRNEQPFVVTRKMMMLK
ncbi:MAG: T9SS type A sorting domain-containing protein [Ignavibacteriae bacterium]|nr:T9SS type A sorting domain-containing protein [Ignavibacteriota bacterium]